MVQYTALSQVFEEAGKGGNREMLKPAQLYQAQLQTELYKTWYELSNIYWNGSSGDFMDSLPDNNFDRHCFVSVDGEDNVIGYICYRVDWVSMSAYNFGMISFKRGNPLFAKDVFQAICNIFEKFNMNRVQWCCYADNPALRGYRNFIKKHGGKECGYYRQTAKLMDGKLHDSVEFEILAEEFHR